MMFTVLYHTHKLAVTLFVSIYVVKTFLLLVNSTGGLQKFSKFIKIPEMIISVLFLLTGGFMVMNVANFGFLFVLKLILVLGAIPVAIIAFKKEKKLMAFISLLMLLGAYGLAEVHKIQFSKHSHDFKEEVITDPNASNYVLSLHGKALYNAQCAVCHGEDGTAGLSGAKDLQKSQMNNEQILNIINNGKNTMPKMEGKYNEQELKALVQYVKELRIKE